jgi:hypothetical protein
LGFSYVVQEEISPLYLALRIEFWQEFGILIFKEKAPLKYIFSRNQDVPVVVHGPDDKGVQNGIVIEVPPEEVGCGKFEAVGIDTVRGHRPPRILLGVGGGLHEFRTLVILADLTAMEEDRHQHYQ